MVPSNTREVLCELPPCPTSSCYMLVSLRLASADPLRGSAARLRLPCDLRRCASAMLRLSFTAPRQPGRRAAAFIGGAEVPPPGGTYKFNHEIHKNSLPIKILWTILINPIHHSTTETIYILFSYWSNSHLLNRVGHGSIKLHSHGHYSSIIIHLRSTRRCSIRSHNLQPEIWIERSTILRSSRILQTNH